MNEFDPTMGALNTSMNLRLINQNVISSNIANADTPGYKSQKMEFEGALRDALGVGHSMAPVETNAKHIAHHPTDAASPEIFDDPNGVESLDGNTVDRSAEMAKMAENQLLYDASAEMLKTAQASVDVSGQASRITLATALSTDFAASKMGHSRPFDRLIYSYSLSMMDDWREALEYGFIDHIQKYAASTTGVGTK
jgi:flagellar basal-body rod protein FlgB